MEHAYAKFLAGVETVTVAVSAPLLHFLERVRVAGGRKGKVLVEVELGAVGGGRWGPKCEEIYGLSKEKRKMLMLAAEHRGVSPPISLWREEPGRSCSRRQQKAATFPGRWPTTSLSGPLTLPCAGGDRVDGSIGGRGRVCSRETLC